MDFFLITHLAYQAWIVSADEVSLEKGKVSLPGQPPFWLSVIFGIPA